MVAGRRFLNSALRRLNSLSKTAVERYRTSRAPVDVRIRRDAHSGVHIWHEEDAGKITRWIFISDELGRALEESGATDIGLIPVKEIKSNSTSMS
jgi:hypothetical protein